MKRSLLLLSILIQSTIGAQTISDQNTSKMEWFEDAKLGIFIHWGIYAVDGISESWAFFNNYISHENYMKQLNGFTASEYQPKEWVNLIKNSGAKYAVITSRHHDGVSLWDSKSEHSISMVKDAKVNQDVLSPFVKELKNSGLKTGLYYSLPDWSHPYYDIKSRSQKRYEIQTEPKRWNSFIKYYQNQLSELSKLYKPDLLWFDGDWEHSSEEWKTDSTLKLLKKYNPNIIINSRLDGKGDYATPEQGIPVMQPQNTYWELCYTMNDSWGFQHLDKHYKTPNMIIRTLIDCIAMGGNLLLDIGPKANGTIPEEQIEILNELGRWTNLYSEAIYGTRAGVDPKFIIEKNAISKDGKTVFVYLDKVIDHLKINGLKTKPSKIRFLGSNSELNFKMGIDGLKIDLQNQTFDPVASVVAIDFDQKPEFILTQMLKAPDLNEILKMKDPQSTIEEIVNQISLGTNLFKGKMNDDASEMDQTLNFNSETVKTWVKKHSEVLHDAKAGIHPFHFYGKTALSANRQTLYLFVEGKPTGPIAIKGLKSEIARIRIVGEGSMLPYEIYNKLYWSPVPGIVYINIPKERMDPNMTVIAILLQQPIELFEEEVKLIHSNF